MALNQRDGIERIANEINDLQMRLQDALELLAAYGWFRIVQDEGRYVTGYWPDDDPRETQ